MFARLKEFFFALPLWLDDRLRRSDRRRHRIEGSWLHRLGLIEGYSSLAFWLPLPVIFAFAYGLPGWWRGWGLLFGTLAAVAVHLVICRFSRGRRLPQYQWLLLLVVAGGAFWAGLGGRQADPEPYAHIFGIFGVVVLALGMPASRWWADWLIGRDHAWYKAEFASRLHGTQLFVKPRGSEGAEKRGIRLVRAYVLALVSSLSMLLVVPSILVLVADEGQAWWFGGASMLLWWALLAMAHYRDRLKSFRVLVREALLVGGALVVSLMVILFAITRLAGVDYVTTVLDQRSRTAILGIIVILYLIFWLYDYWRERALTEVLLGLLNEGDDLHPRSIEYKKKPGARLSIHGAGRLIAIRPGGPNAKELFESYQPLDVFREIVDQLESRARHRQADWPEVDAAAEALDSMEEKSRLYTLLPAVVMVLLILGAYAGVSGREQQVAFQAESTAGSFDLGERLRTAKAGETYYAVAASGGGTRAALYSYAVLRALRAADALDRVVLVSSVSGGSAGAAYFAAHRQNLVSRPVEDPVWSEYRSALAGEHIKRVLDGVGEWRFTEGMRLGELLTESFEEHFYPAGCETIGCAEVGVLFNTSVTGAWRKGERNWKECRDEGRKMRDCATVDRTGSRLVITNVRSVTEENLHTRAGGWPLDFDYEVVHWPKTPLATAASISANFPPIFSNAAVHLDAEAGNERRYWLTDGGAVENRGVITLLLALLAEADEWQQEGPPPSIKILVADASGTSIAYGEDRGIGAASAAKRQIADKLIADLGQELERIWSELGGGGATAELVHLPMPEALRVGFGTHWQLPASIAVKDPDGWFLNSKLEFWRRPDSVELEMEQIECLADRLLAEDRDAPCEGPEGEDPVSLEPVGGKLWRWAAADSGGDPRCELFRAVGVDSADCDSAGN